MTFQQCSAYTLALLALVSSAVIAAPAPGTSGSHQVHFVSPLARAKTFQVTETLFEAQDGARPGPLAPAGVLRIQMQLPNKFRVVFRQPNTDAALSIMVSDGTTLWTYNGSRTTSQPASMAKWPFPLMRLVKTRLAIVSAVPAEVNGRKLLRSITSLGASKLESLYDTRTHLLVRQSVFVPWQGKPTEAIRTAYSGWALNAPIPQSAFLWKSGAIGKRRG